MTHSPVDIGTLIDEARWGRYQKWLVFLAALTIVFDGIDNQLLGIVIPTVMKEWDVPRSAFAPIVSLGYAGMMIGGALAGLSGDRWGRRSALLGSMVIFGVMTVGAALVHDTGALGILRFLAGIGLGGAMPNAAALAAEYVPLRRRPLAVTVTIVCVPLGGTLAGLLGAWVLPHIGWRMLFVYGGVIPVVGALLLRFQLPESPRFLARHPARFGELVTLLGRMGHALPPDTRFIDATEGRAKKVSVATLFTAEFLRDTVGLWLAFFSCLLGVYLGFSWLVTLLAGAGFDPSTANSGITSFNLGGVAGALIGGVAIGRFGSRASMLTMTALAVVCTVVLSRMTITPAMSLVPIFVMLVLTGAFINGVQTTMYALAAHVYPSAVRATGVGTAVAFGRSGAILTGYVGSWAIGFNGTHSFFLVMGAAMVVTFVGLAIVHRHVPVAAGASGRRA